MLRSRFCMLCLVLCVGALIYSSASTLRAERDLVQLSLGHYIFEVPRKYDMSNSIPLWLRWLPGLDDGSSSALFRFENVEVRDSVGGYTLTGTPDRDNIRILVSVLTPEEIRRYQDPEIFSDLGDLWRGQRRYQGRKVEPYGANGWHKVYSALEYPDAWTLLNQYPDEQRPVPNTTLEFWIAHCRKGGPDRRVRCKSHFLIDDIQIEFRISDYNLGVIGEVKDFLQDKVTSWIKAKVPS